MALSFLNGANYGNIFIPEDFFANDEFYIANGINKVADQYSLCDLKSSDSASIMTNWLHSQIQEQDFKEMKDFGVNFVRLPLGYWNVVDMPYNPNGPANEAARMGNLSHIMADAESYKPYIDQVFSYASKYGLQVMLDLHGAPGSQSGESNAGCSFKYNGKDGEYYWDSAWNREWTVNAVTALARICKDKGDACYGVELLNEPAFPGGGIDRGHLLDFYHTAIKAARSVGLPMSKPMVVMEWAPHWDEFWDGKWQQYFPESEYGKVFLDTHVYDFKNTVAEEEASWATNQWPTVERIAKEVSLMIGEYTLSLSADIPTEQLQGWANWIESNLHSTGTIGGAHWTWKNKPRKFWSMRSMSTLETTGGIDWSQTFAQTGVDIPPVSTTEMPLIIQ